jgi:CubicO group peptidase (beta-lactamase class C family)
LRILRAEPVLLVAVAFLTSCGAISARRISDPAPAVARLRAGGSIQAEVDRLVRPLIQSGQVLGMVVGVLTPDGATRTYGYGRTGGTGDSGPPSGDTIFEVGSVSKAFVAALLVVLVNEGRLHYDDTVRDILPKDVPVSADAERLSLYELATHTGGLPRQPNNFIQGRYLVTYLFTGQNLYGYLTKDYLYEYLRTCRLNASGAGAYAYSNLGFGLLAHLIEVKTERSLPDLVDEEICRPLNLRDTGFVLNAEQRQRLAVGHVGGQPLFMRRNEPLAPWDMGEIMRGAGALYTSVDDLLIFAQSHLGLLHNELDTVLASSHRVQFQTPGEGVALGWSVDELDGGRLTITYIHGFVAGYTAYVGMDVDRRIAVVALANNVNFDDHVGHNLMLRLAGASDYVSTRTAQIP